MGNTIGESKREEGRAEGAEGRRQEDRVEETWHRGMQLHNAAGPPPTPTTYYYSTYAGPTGPDPVTRMWTPGPFDRVDFSSTITLEHYTWRELDLTPD